MNKVYKWINIRKVLIIAYFFTSKAALQFNLFNNTTHLFSFQLLMIILILYKVGKQVNLILKFVLLFARCLIASVRTWKISASISPYIYIKFEQDIFLKSIDSFIISSSNLILGQLIIFLIVILSTIGKEVISVEIIHVWIFIWWHFLQ